MRLSIIAAVAENGVIGRQGKLPWHLSADLRRFKQLTMGHTIVMGRRTWESIGRPLPGRRTIVITRQPDYRAEGVSVVHSLDDALRQAAASGDEEAFVIGGAEVYRLALPQADRLYLTLVVAEPEIQGDTFFPFDHLDWNDWALVESESHDADEQNDHFHLFQIFERCNTQGTTSK